MMSEPKVICCIQAFDCEKTIEAAMSSVLKQTYENWLCFVLSNGNENTVEAPNWSFDKIKNFAARDRRFVVINKRHNDTRMYFWMLCHFANSFPNAYLCTLDADDEYTPDFFAHGIALAEKYSLDIVACGTEIILKKRVGEPNGVLLRRRETTKTLIIEQEEMSGMFPVYKPYFNEMWGKLYRARLLRRKDYTQYIREKIENRFLADTLFTIDCLEKSRSIGILAGVHHRFFQYEERSASNATLIANAILAKGQEGRNEENRFSVYDTYEKIINFLRSRGEVDGELYEYMQAVLTGWFEDYYNRVLIPLQNENDFVSLAARLVLHPKFDETITYRGNGKYDILKDYRRRLDFCERLRYTLIGQAVVQNGFFTEAVRQLWERLDEKLAGTVQTLAKLQEG